MELFGELFLTAFLALFLSFLVAKLVAAAMAAGDSGSKSTEVSDEDFVGALRFQGSEDERKVEFVEEVVENVDRFSEEVVEEGSGDRSEISDDLPGGGSAESEANEAVTVAVSSEPDEARVQGDEPEVRDEASEVGSRRSVGDEDDDWEGIERDERESDFAAAVEFVESRAGGGDLPASFVGGGDLVTELYGLRKVATEGTCRETMPEALELSDRVKWHAWQGLGNMTREAAMERYIAILSASVPGWMEDRFTGEKKQECSEGKTMVSDAPVFRTNEREPDGKSGVESADFAGASELETKAVGQQLLSSS